MDLEIETNSVSHHFVPFGYHHDIHHNSGRTVLCRSIALENYLKNRSLSSTGNSKHPRGADYWMWTVHQRGSGLIGSMLGLWHSCNLKLLRARRRIINDCDWQPRRWLFCGIVHCATSTIGWRPFQTAGIAAISRTSGIAATNLRWPIAASGKHCRRAELLRLLVVAQEVLLCTRALSLRCVILVPWVAICDCKQCLGSCPLAVVQLLQLQVERLGLWQTWAATASSTEIRIHKAETF